MEKTYYYYDVEEGILFTTSFRNCGDGVTRETVSDKIHPYAARWRWIDVLEVFNPIYRPVFTGDRIV